MTRSRTPAGVDDISAGTVGPTPSDGKIYKDHSHVGSGAVEGGEVEKPAKMTTQPEAQPGVEFDNQGRPIPLKERTGDHRAEATGAAAVARD